MKKIFSLLFAAGALGFGSCSNNSEKGSKHTMTTWYWLLLKPATGSKPLVTALIVMGLFVAGLLWWDRSAKKTAA